MKLVIISISILSIISSLFALKNTLELCALTQPAKEKCIGKFNYPCGNEFCADGRISCEKFLTTIKMLGSFYQSKTYRSQMRNYDHFVGSFKRCQEKNNALVNIINRIFHI